MNGFTLCITEKWQSTYPGNTILILSLCVVGSINRSSRSITSNKLIFWFPTVTTENLFIGIFNKEAIISDTYIVYQAG